MQKKLLKKMGEKMPNAKSMQILEIKIKIAKSSCKNAKMVTLQTRKQQEKQRETKKKEKKTKEEKKQPKKQSQFKFKTKNYL